MSKQLVEKFWMGREIFVYWAADEGAHPTAWYTGRVIAIYGLEASTCASVAVRARVHLDEAIGNPASRQRTFLLEELRQWNREARDGRPGLEKKERDEMMASVTVG